MLLTCRRLKFRKNSTTSTKKLQSPYSYNSIKSIFIFLSDFFFFLNLFYNAAFIHLFRNGYWIHVSQMVHSIFCLGHLFKCPFWSSSLSSPSIYSLFPSSQFPIPVTHTVLRIKVSFYLMECAQLYFIIARKIHMPHF